MRGYGRRKKKLVGRLQCRFVGFLLGYFLLMMGTLVGVLVIPPMVQLSLAERDFSVLSSAATQLLYLHSRLWPAMGVVLVLFAVHAVIFSHRIAGPLLRIRRLLREVGAGDLGKEIRIRRNDLIHAEVDALNAMLRDLEDRVGGIQAACHRACEAVGELDGLVNLEASAPGCELKRAMEDMRGGLDGFRLGSGEAITPVREAAAPGDTAESSEPGDTQEPTAVGVAEADSGNEL